MFAWHDFVATSCRAAIIPPEVIAGWLVQGSGWFGGPTATASGIGSKYGLQTRRSPCPQSGGPAFPAPADPPMPVPPVGQITPAVGPASGVKIFPFCSLPNQFTHAPSHPARGAARDRHETRGGMRWPRWTRLTSVTRCGRRSRVVLTPRRWRQVSRVTSWSDGGKKARSPGRARSKP